MRIELLFGVGGVGWGVCGGGGGRGEQKVNRWSTIYRWTRCMCMRCCDNLSICHCHSIPHAIYMIFGIRFTTWECIMHSHVVHLYECNFWMIHLMIPAPKWLHEIWMWYDGWSSNDFASPSVLWVLQRREDWLQLVAGQVAEHTSQPTRTVSQREGPHTGSSLRAPTQGCVGAETREPRNWSSAVEGLLMMRRMQSPVMIWMSQRWERRGGGLWQRGRRLTLMCVCKLFV